MIQTFNFEKTSIEGLVKIRPFYAQDLRGGFTKDYSKKVFCEHGIDHNLQEVFYTTSKKGVIRALHFQRVKQQPKLVRCVCGYVWDVVVDLRKDSKTFKKWLSFDLFGNSELEILVPAGCAHGYLVIEPSIVSYKCSEDFFGEYDDGIIWNDKELSIDWPLSAIGGVQNIILSEKDKSLQTFSEFCLNNNGGF